MDLPRNQRKVRHPVRRISHLSQQPKPVQTHGGVGIVDQHLVEEGVYGRPQVRQMLHGGGEVLGLQRLIHPPDFNTKGGYERGLLRRCASR